jgi:hypothetical protein
MASLLGTTGTTINIPTSISATHILNNSVSSVQQWAGYVGVPTPYYEPSNNFVNLLGNNNGYAWIVGYLSIPANQSYNSCHDFWFALSRYGVKILAGATNDGLLTLSHYQDPGNANINYIRLTNTYNASWAYGNYHICATVFTGSASNSIISSYLTRIN